MEDLIAYTINLTPAQKKALEYVAYDAQDWIENVVHERCRVSIDEIFLLEVERITLEGGQISGSKEDIVLAAQIKSAKERELEYEQKYLDELKLEEEKRLQQEQEEVIAREEDEELVRSAYENL